MDGAAASPRPTGPGGPGELAPPARAPGDPRGEAGSGGRAPASPAGGPGVSGGRPQDGAAGRAPGVRGPAGHEVGQAGGVTGPSAPGGPPVGQAAGPGPGAATGTLRAAAVVRVAAERARPRRPGLRDLGVGLLFVLPYAVLWAVFLVWPILYGFLISLHRWQPPLATEWVGLQNYLVLWRTPRFWNAALNTAKFAGLVIPLILGLGLGFALLLHRRRVRGLTAVESALFFPYLLNVSIVSIVWMFLFDPDVGLVPHGLRRAGLPAPTFLNDPAWVLPAIAVTTAWWLAGYRMVVFRAALQAIPEELYESAALDGAGPWSRLRHLTLPLLKPALLFATVLTLVGGLRTFGQVILMTGGGPGLASEVLALYMYRLAFQFLNFGQAAAVGFILFGTIFALSLLLFRALGFESELR